MSRSLDEHDGIAIAQISIFPIILIGAIRILVKNGFKGGSAWFYLAIFSLARAIGCILRLATISSPTNVGLYVGWYVILGLGLGPLILVLLGMLGCVFDSINRQGHVVVKPIFQRVIHLLVMAGVALLIAGTSTATATFSGQEGLHIEYPTTAHAGIAILVVVVGLTYLQTIYAFLNQGYVSQGDHRLIIAVAICLPFLTVRLVYSCLIIIGQVKNTANLYLGTSAIMEIIVATVCLVAGFFVVGRQPKAYHDERNMEMGQGHA